MDTQNLIDIKKQRIREELEKLVPPGFTLQSHPKNRTSIYDNLDKFLGIDETLSREVGYLVATNKGYNEAIDNLRFFGVKINEYKDVANTGPFFNNPKLNKDLEEACNYTIRFYELSKITIKRINDEEDVRLELIQKQREKEKNELEKNQAEEKKQKAKSFFSGATKFRPGTTAKLKVTKLPGIIPKRTVPQEVVEKISKPQLQVEETEEGIGGSKRIVSALGRLALSLEQTNDNLEAAISKIADDIKNTKDENRKEVDEYRKRVANRGKKIGRKELGSSKVDVSGVVKKYLGSFFSGAGGAIRALALFNMLEAFMNGRPLDALGPLLGIGATYLPQIGGVIAGLLAKKVLGGLAGAARGGAVARGGVTAARGARAVAGMPKLGKFGAIAALGAGALALGSGMLSKKEEESSAPQESQGQSAIQTRLDELEAQQKGSTQPQAISPIPDDAISKFDQLNQKFEKALDFLLKKQKEQRSPMRGGGGSPGGGPSPQPSINQLTTDVPQDVVSTGQNIDIGEGISYYGPGFEGNKTASGTTFDPNEMTAAHKTLPFGTLLRVTNKDNNKSVVVRITDRGPFVGNRSLDLSEGAMRQLGGIGTGVLQNATIEIVSPKSNTSPATPPARPATPPAQPVQPASKPKPEPRPIPGGAAAFVPLGTGGGPSSNIASAAGEGTQAGSVSTGYVCVWKSSLESHCNLIDSIG